MTSARCSRLALLLFALVAAWFLAACDDTSTTYVVDSAVDRPDADPGDGACATPDGLCTLRAAVMEANTDPGPDTVVIADGIDPALTTGTVAPDDASTGDLDVVAPLTVQGGGATIGAGRASRHFDVLLGARLTIQEVTLADGMADDDSGGDGDAGGAIRTAGPVDLLAVTVYKSIALGDGGAIASTGPGAPVTAIGSSLVRSTAETGGAVHADGARVGFTSSTLSANTARGGAGGAVALTGAATAELLDSTVTVTASATGGALDDHGSGIRLGNTVVADQAGGDDCSGVITTDGFNLDSDGTCLPVPGPGDRTVADAGLDQLADNGGPTETHLPLVGSPLIDSGRPDCHAHDQRALPRPADGNGDGTPKCDTGATEAPDVAPPGPPVTLVQRDADGTTIATWSPPTDDGGTPVTGYEVRYTTDVDFVTGQLEPNPVWVPAGTTTETSVQLACTGLLQRCVISVAARNAVGVGPWAIASTAVVAPPDLPPWEPPPCGRCG